MYLPKHQYEFKKQSDLDGIEGLRDKAGEIINSNKEIVITSTGKIFDKLGIDFEKGDFSKAKELFVKTFKEDVDPGLNDEGQEEYSSSETRAVSFKTPPNRKNLKDGIMTRVFYKNTSTGKVKEITLNSAKEVEKTMRSYEKIYYTPWFVKGPAKDQIVNGYFLEGMETKNQNLLNKLAQELPGAELLVKGPTEYLVDTLPITDNNIQPVKTGFDIPAPSTGISVSKNEYKNPLVNPLPDFKGEYSEPKVKENLYANPGEFLLKGTNREYVGFYHIHPIKGPMVGAKHVSTPHSKLVPRDKSNTRFGVETTRRSNETQKLTPQSSPTTVQVTQNYSNTNNTSTPSTSGTTTGGSSGGGSSSSGGGGY
jgi:hypothetical protein